jgi:hypothetical protein
MSGKINEMVELKGLLNDPINIIETEQNVLIHEIDYETFMDMMDQYLATEYIGGVTGVFYYDDIKEHNKFDIIVVLFDETMSLTVRSETGDLNKLKDFVDNVIERLKE